MAAHAAMLDVQDLIKKEAQPGVQCGEIYEMALERTRQLGYNKYFQGADSERVRFVGHGVGIELDEYPFLASGQKMALQNNMTLALEPKLIFPEKGVVGIENTHVVTAQGLDQLGQFQDEVVVI